MTNISELEEKAAREIMALITAPCAIYDSKVRDKHYFDRIGAIVRDAITTKDQEIERLKGELEIRRKLTARHYDSECWTCLNGDPCAHKELLAQLAELEGSCSS